MAQQFALVEHEISKTDWHNLRGANGSASSVPRALRNMIYAIREQSAEAAYWQLENHVVVQGGLFDSAVHIVPVLCAALSYELSDFARGWTLELLFQIVNGTTSTEEYQRGLRDLEVKCREAALPCLWLLYHQVLIGHSSLAREIVRRVDPDVKRRAILDEVQCDKDL
jgi:hypothetical protein